MTRFVLFAALASVLALSCRERSAEAPGATQSPQASAKAHPGETGAGHAPGQASAGEAHTGHDQAGETQAHEAKAADPHAGCDHAREANAADPHAGHDHAREAQAGDAHAGHDHAGGARADKTQAGEARAGDAHAGHGHEGHGHGEEGSDLDRPVETLFEARCEHGVHTFACDECRYEVGVARAPQTLFKDKLLEIVQASRRRIESPITLTGEIKFDERRVAHLAAQSDGVIRRVHVGLGDHVEKGQALVELESMAVGEAENDYLEAQANLRLARRNFERQDQLRKDQITSEREHLEAKRELEAAEIRSRGSAEKLSRLGMSRTAIDQIGRGSAARLVLRAPASGTVLVLHAVPGEVARAEESLVTLGDLGTLWLWADLYERDLARVSEHQARQRLAAEVSVKAFPRDTFQGRVDFIGPTMDETSRTIKTRIEVKNPDGKLRPGMFATVNVFLPGEVEALAVPSGAVLSDEGRSFVFVHHHDDFFVRRPVKPGRRWAGFVEILDGLAPGSRVVGEGSFLLKSDVLRSKMGAGCAD